MNQATRFHETRTADKLSQMMKYQSSLILVLFLLVSCGRNALTFEDQIIRDVQTYAATGICDHIPAGSDIQDIQIGTISTLEETGLIRVRVDFDVVSGSLVQRITETMLYTQHEKEYTLESMSGCRYVQPGQSNK